MIVTASYGAALLPLAGTCAGFIGQPVWGIGGLTGILALAYAALLCSMLGFWLMTFGNQYVDASISACYVMLQPVAACVASFFAFGTTITWLDVLGTVLAFVGLFTMGRANSSPSPTIKLSD